MQVTQVMETEGYWGARLAGPIVAVSSPELYEWERRFTEAGVPTILWARERRDWMKVGEAVDVEVTVRRP